MQKFPLLVGVFALSLAACSPEKTADTTTAPVAPTAPAPDATAGVERTEPAEAAAPPATPALATQPGPKGMQVALTKARVTGDILTVELHYIVPPAADSKTESAQAELDQVTYIDDATSRKYNVLKDQEGTYMALPLGYNKKHVNVTARKAGPGIASFKFPAPPASSTTISLSVPEVGSFDAIPLQR